MRKISLIKGEAADLIVGANPLREIYGVGTVTTSEAIANIVDLISDLDLLTELGYDSYLANKKAEFDTLEGVINDTIHMRNLFVVSDTDMAALVLKEREAYVKRADLKVEIMFVETNEQYVSSLVNIIRKINKFNSRKNTRIYTPKVLNEFGYVMEENK